MEVVVVERERDIPRAHGERYLELEGTYVASDAEQEFGMFFHHMNVERTRQSKAPYRMGETLYRLGNRFYLRITP